MSLHKIPNSSTSATSFNHPNTIMLRDTDGASRVSSLIMKGADFVKDCVSSNAIISRGYLYFSNNANHGYALFRNAETTENHIHLSLEFGQNNKCGNFSIRTENRTNFIIRNNKIGINKPNPAATLDVSGTVITSGLMTANGPVIVNNTFQVTNLREGGPVYASSNGQLFVSNEPRISNIPFHIVDASASIPFATRSIFVLEIPIEINLPSDMYDGYSMTIINKSGESVSMTTIDNMFNVFYLPNGGTQFSLDEHRKMELTYCQTATNKSWIFNTY